MIEDDWLNSGAACEAPDRSWRRRHLPHCTHWTLRTPEAPTGDLPSGAGPITPQTTSGVDASEQFQGLDALANDLASTGRGLIMVMGKGASARRRSLLLWLWDWSSPARRCN